MNSLRNQCLIIPVRLHGVSAAPYRNATNQRSEHEANCENNMVNVYLPPAGRELLSTVHCVRPGLVYRTYVDVHAVQA